MTSLLLPRRALRPAFALACAIAAPLPAQAGTVLVELREPLPGKRTAAVADDSDEWRPGATITGRWVRVQSPPGLAGAALEAWTARLRADARVAGATPDRREQRLDVTPNDARWGEQWWLQAVTVGNGGAAGFTTAWGRGTGAPTAGAGPVVAVLDSGITSHPELNPRVLPGFDFVADPVYANDGDGRDNDPSDPGDAVTPADRTGNPAAFGNCPSAAFSSWHGTTIAGQLAAVTNNREGVAAGNWFGRVLPVRIAGKCGASVADIVDGMRWAAGLPVAGVPANPHPARVVVLGYGGPESCDTASADPGIAATARLYRDAIDEVRRAGAIVVVAAGNQRSAVGRPAGCTGAFAVASLNRQGFKSTYSNFGREIALATPGGDGSSGGTCDALLADSGIVSTGNLGDVTPGAAGYVAASGTSFAAPAAAAVASLMLALNPALTVAQVEDGLRRSARPHAQVPALGSCSAPDNAGRCACTAQTCGAGILDADQALAFAAAPAAWTPPVRSAVPLDDDRLRQCAALLGRTLPEPASAPPAPTPDTAAAGGGGGGAMTGLWLLGLAAAAASLARPDRGRGLGAAFSAARECAAAPGRRSRRSARR